MHGPALAPRSDLVKRPVIFGRVIGPDDVRAAARVLDGVAERTPVLTSRTLDELVGARVFIKAENLQRVGAFKFRGAYNRIASLSDDERARGVVAFSSGNHAQAVALASRLLGVSAVIVMPEDAPALKLDATRGYGAEVVTYDRYSEDRVAIGSAIASERGLTLVHPFEDPLVMAGQGTAALELIEDAGELDLFLAPMSGGGLMAGCATIVADLCPDARIVGVEPEASDDNRRSLDAGERVQVPMPHTIADALQLTIPGEHTFEINRRLVDEVVTVTDDEILGAMKFLFERMKIVSEPGGAVAVAALIARKITPGPRTGLILSGGNIGAARFAELLGTRH
jgi:threo-3-hydroxy-L-aspartate ammonia-lyase